MHFAIKYLAVVFLLFFASFLASQELTLKVGNEPPPLDCTIIPDGKQPSPTWEDLKDQVVILDFWATWCPPCIESIPHMNELVEAFKDKPVAFLSITYEPERMIQPFLEKHPMKSKVASDNDFKMFRSFKAFGIPTIVIVDQKRKVAAVIHPTHLTREVIETVLAGKIPGVPQAKGWPEPEGAEEYFRSLIK